MEKDYLKLWKEIGGLGSDDFSMAPQEAVAALEEYIEGERVKALGWAWTCACILLDEGEDPRLVEISSILKAALADLAQW